MNKSPQAVGPTGESATRRSFLKRGSALAAVGIAPYFVPSTAFGAAAPSNRITLACIGVGNQGAAIMQRFLDLADCQVVAVCDVNRASHGYKDDSQFLGREVAQQTVNDFYAKRKNAGAYAGCDGYVDFREVLARTDVDAVTVCAPDHWHAAMTVAAAEAKKDVYCEKPLALNIAQGRAMINAVRKHGIVLQTGSHERSNPIVRQACELVRNGYIGDIRRVTTNVGYHNKVGPGPGWLPMPAPEGFDYAMWLGPAPEAPYHRDRCLYNFRFIYDYAGGQVANFGAHSNDMAQWGLGMDGSGPMEIDCLEAEFLPAGSLFNAATVTKFRCRYENGVELLCQTDEKQVRCVFEGTEGRVEIENKGQNFKTSPKSLATVKLREDQVLSTSTNHQQDFLDCTKSRREPSAPVEVGHSSAVVCHLGNIAVRLGAKGLAWDPRAERFTNNDEANKLLSCDMRSPWHV